ncbi:hypothetical protein FACS1894125_0940 [Actinomycetota bacterium]|nr:hypothetical protein FACS1894125_0940 [Actinomycetota bacterium]
MTADITKLSKLVGEKLLANKWSICTAESITGGLVADALVQTSGASKYFKGGVVSYTNAVKSRVLGVEWTLLIAKGAVDPEVAFQMCVGAIKAMDTDCAISTTGYAQAGEKGEKGEKAGLVYVGVITPQKRIVRQFNLCEDDELSRNQVRHLALEQALKLFLE